MVYKIISKAIVNRLKRILASIISKEQSTFISDRQIIDNMVAFESAHTINCRIFGTDALLALKLDMGKAYDRVEWSFLRCMIQYMGFHEWWIQLMTCISSITYSVLNGHIHGNIFPKQGERFPKWGNPKYLSCLTAAVKDAIHQLLGIMLQGWA